MPSGSRSRRSSPPAADPAAKSQTSATASSAERAIQSLPLQPSLRGSGGGAPVGRRRSPPTLAVRGRTSLEGRWTGALTAAAPPGWSGSITSTPAPSPRTRRWSCATLLSTLGGSRLTLGGRRPAASATSSARTRPSCASLHRPRRLRRRRPDQLPRDVADRPAGTLGRTRVRLVLGAVGDGQDGGGRDLGADPGQLVRVVLGQEGEQLLADVAAQVPVARRVG